MAGCTRPGVRIWLLVSVWFCPAASAQDKAAGPDAEQARAEYQQWVDRYGRKEMTGRMVGGEASRLRLVITAVHGEEREPADERRLFGTGISTYHTELSVEGRVSHFSHTDRGSKGSGGGPPLPDADLQRLDELLANLPADGMRLPPAGRRVLVQAAVGDRTIRRVYDTAHAPDEVWEVLRLGRSGLRAWVPQFEPQSEIEAHRSAHGGFLRLSSDGRQVLFTLSNGPLQFWEPTTHELLSEVRGLWGDEIAFSPDNAQAAIINWGECLVVNTRTWKQQHVLAEPQIDRRRQGLSVPQFTADGRYLLLHSGEPALRVFDTNTWQRVDRPPYIPDDALVYVRAPKGHRALVQSSEEIYLWDADQRRVISTFDKSGHATHAMPRAAFSPDESLVAIVTRKKTPEEWRYNVRIWKTETGELLHELRPFEQATCEAVEGLIWSPDGQYLMAATKADSFFTSRGISVWNARTGRHRGEFTGPGTNVNGIALLPDGRRLVAGSTDGSIRFWDFPAAMQHIRKFEDSLPVSGAFNQR